MASRCATRSAARGAAAAGAARRGRRRARPQAGRRDHAALAAAARQPIPTSSPSGWSTGPRPRPTASFWPSATRRRRWRTLTYAQALAQVRAHRAGAARARSVARAADRDPVRQRHRARAARRSPRMIVGMPYAPISVPYSLMSSDFGKLQVDHRDADARPGVRCRRRAVRARDRGGGAGRRRDRGHAPIRSAGRHGDAVRRPARRASRPRRSMRRTPRSAPTRSRKSCSPPARPAYPKGVINTQRMLCANQARSAPAWPSSATSRR